MNIPKNIKGIIFDYDGVLGDSDAFNNYACKEAAKKCGIDLSTEIYRKCAPGGATIKDIATCIVTHYGMPEKVEEYIGYKRQYDEEYVKVVSVLPSVIETIQKLHNKYILAVNTGTRHALVDGFLGKYDLTKYLKLVIASEDIKKGKPDPESYLLACEKLGLTPVDCMVIEDGISGVVAAEIAGCYVVGISNNISKEKLLELGCDEIITDLSELMAPTST
jgi:HAD superfamily hydrolase (TIGR01509 family)